MKAQHTRKSADVHGGAGLTTSQPKKPGLVGKFAIVAVGVAFTAQDMVGETVSNVWDLNKRMLRAAGELSQPLRGPLEAAGVSQLVTRPLDTLGEQLESTVRDLATRGRTGIANGDGLVLQSVDTVIDAILVYLTDNPEVDTLIRTQIDRLMPMLAKNPAVHALIRDQVQLILPELMTSPEIQALIRVQAGQYLDYLMSHPDQVQALIREQGDTYIDYLNAHPTAVQTLIQGQSLSLAGQVRDEVRERTVTGDSMVDTIVRSLLRLKPRDELPPPSEAVQERAEMARLPADYIRENTNGDT